MNASGWRRVRELFEEALERDPATLSAWLERTAPGDEALQREVRSLLSHHTLAGSFLFEPVSVRAPALLQDSDPLHPGDRVGPYSVVREIGRGGMGRVYLAVDGRLGREVALKALPFSFADDPARRERLRQEAQAAARLTHPGICTVYALEEIDGALFIAAEYIDGRTLREEIASGARPSPEELATMARDVGAALAAAHARSIVHGDLKPENIMRASDGRWKILDFGLARIDTGWDAAAGAGGAVDAAPGGALIGTPAYMAPEQLNGRRADARSDVFAFAVSVYEYATGAHPFAAPTALSMAARVLEGECTPLETARPDVPAELPVPLARCLRKAPGDRWPNAIDMVLAFARAGAPPQRPAAAMWWRTHQVVLMALYVLACIVAWNVKEWAHGLTDATFVIVGIGAAFSGVLRGHLLFTEWINPAGLKRELQRAEPLTLAGDLLLAGCVALSGALIAPRWPLDGMLTIAFAVGVALARLVLEPATTAATVATD